MKSMFKNFEEKMLNKGISKLAIKIFELNFNKMIKGDSFVYKSEDINPILETNEILDLNQKIDLNETKNLASKVAVIKLNGGLGTSMGLKGPKSQLVVKNNLNFLEITVNQIQKFNLNFSTNVPLIFMNSFNTEEETFANLEKLNFHNKIFPNSFIENKSPKIRRIESEGKISFEPAEYIADPDLEWAPPGHADVYPALYESNLLDSLLSKGYEYVFISNIDNLGANLNPQIIKKVFDMKSSFIMEVAKRTENDKKGGHIAFKNGKLILRESSQVIKEDENDFQDFNKYKFFNTNSIWIKIKTLKELLDKNNGILDLPIIINIKNINPSDTTSEKVIQLESAMGSAITLFEDAKTILVPSERFIPVKNTSNLLYLLSDLVEMDENFTLHPIKNIFIDLKNNNYKFVEGFFERFKVIPSLKNCESLIVENDIFFNESQEFKGKVHL
jgi:UTP--glucose-1-phosphate uridylyltransferase